MRSDAVRTIVYFMIAAALWEFVVRPRLRDVID
jgi:hypothetical protein